MFLHLDMRPCLRSLRGCQRIGVREFGDMLHLPTTVFCHSDVAIISPVYSSSDEDSVTNYQLFQRVASCLGSLIA